jgi:hypothetical protein
LLEALADALQDFLLDPFFDTSALFSTPRQTLCSTLWPPLSVVASGVLLVIPRETGDPHQTIFLGGLRPAIS